MSPELIQTSTYNSKNDIWSIGVCMYELSTGDPCTRKVNMNGRQEIV